jgi:hypothetical protein
MTKSRGINRPRVYWTAADLATLTARYADTRTADLAVELGRPEAAIYSKARVLGLSKSEAFLASDKSGRVQRGKQNPAMRATQFKPGALPWNTGTKGLVGVHPNCRAAQFKPGRPPQESRNYLPIGSRRVNCDGYLEEKVTDDQSIVPARRWVAVHRLVWQAANGPIPRGYAVVFKPGRKTALGADITVDAVELVSRAELMKRNSVNNLPTELVQLVKLRGALVRKINARSKK